MMVKMYVTKNPGKLVSTVRKAKNSALLSITKRETFEPRVTAAPSADCSCSSGGAGFLNHLINVI